MQNDAKKFEFFDADDAKFSNIVEFYDDDAKLCDLCLIWANLVMTFSALWICGHNIFRFFRFAIMIFSVLWICGYEFLGSILDEKLCLI